MNPDGQPCQSTGFCGISWPRQDNSSTMGAMAEKTIYGFTRLNLRLCNLRLCLTLFLYRFIGSIILLISEC